MKTRVALAAAAATLVAGLGCGLSDPSTVTPGGGQIEDCDAEDWANREDDCGFTDWDRRKTAKPSPRKTTGPSPRTTKGRR